MTVTVFVYLIAFGGNTGDRVQNARGALLRLGQFGRTGRQSQWKITEPLRSDHYDTSDHEVYLNFVFEFITDLAPNELYCRICAIEDDFGHDRVHRWRPRAVDFDLLFCARQGTSDVCFEPSCAFEYRSAGGFLQLPHPQIWQRNFLLEMIETDLQIDLKILAAPKSAAARTS